MVDDCSKNWFKSKVQMVFPYHKVRREVEVKDPAVPAVPAVPALQPNAALPSPRFSGTRHTANPAPPLHHLDVLAPRARSAVRYCIVNYYGSDNLREMTSAWNMPSLN